MNKCDFKGFLRGVISGGGFVIFGFRVRVRVWESAGSKSLS